MLQLAGPWGGPINLDLWLPGGIGFVIAMVISILVEDWGDRRCGVRARRFCRCMVDMGVSAFRNTAWLVLLLTGCATQQERVHQAAVVPQSVDVQDDTLCRSYGDLPSSDAYVKCRLQLTQGRQAAAAQAAAEQAAFSRGQVARRAATTTATGAAPTACISKPVGATVVTECK